MAERMRAISLGFSPCPNDTFIFHALVHGLVADPGLRFDPRMEDVETLNRLALAAELDVTKVSFGVLPDILASYTLLRAGGALGRGCGPLIVARKPLDRDALRNGTTAIPGKHTTANLLLRLYDPELPPGMELPYERILSAVARGEVDAGLIIHESRFTYPEHGLEKIVDLGEWWESTTGTPIPLGGIVARRNLGDDVIGRIERTVRQSVEYAFQNPTASSAYVAGHAQEMRPDVIRSHIDLYVNDFSIDLGFEGSGAVQALWTHAIAAGILTPAARDPFRLDRTI
jgi:1,4-dihydroxy-6-naphthoate synthase